MNCKSFFDSLKEEKLNHEALEKKRKRHKELKNTLEKNYANTFVKSVERAANRRFKNDKIKKIELEYILNRVTKVNIYGYDGNLIHDKNIENQIMKFADMKRKALDANSDARFVERKHKPNMVENLYNRSLGEETCFDY